MAKARWVKTEFKGVRYRQHPTRRHGVQFDRYFVLTYKLDGKTVTEAAGWASEGVKPSEAYKLLAELKQNQRTGNGPRTLAEMRTIADEDRKAKAKLREQTQRDRISVKEFFEGDYLNAQFEAGKKPDSIRREKELFKLFIGSEIGAKTFKEVSPFDVERIKAKMARTDRAPRTIQYALAVVRQIFNAARFHGLHDRESPTLRVKKPKFDNKRVRFLTEQEAGNLLVALKKKSATLHMQAILGLYAGLRFGEIASLTWGDVDLDRGILTLRDTKSGKTRPAFITEKIKTEVFGLLAPGRPDDLVFPSTSAKGIEGRRVSSVFRDTVNEIGLNDGLADPRQRVCFHTLRHTFASWLVERDTDLFQVSKLLGHSTIALTERYSHLRPGRLQEAVKALDREPQRKVVDLSAGGRGVTK